MNNVERKELEGVAKKADEEFKEISGLSKKLFESCIVLKAKLEDEDAKKAMDDVIKMISQTSLAISMFKLAYFAQLLSESDDKKSKTQA